MVVSRDEVEVVLRLCQDLATSFGGNSFPFFTPEHQSLTCHIIRLRQSTPDALSSLLVVSTISTCFDLPMRSHRPRYSSL